MPENKEFLALATKHGAAGSTAADLDYAGNRRRQFKTTSPPPTRTCDSELPPRTAAGGHGRGHSNAAGGSAATPSQLDSRHSDRPSASRPARETGLVTATVTVVFTVNTAAPRAAWAPGQSAASGLSRWPIALGCSTIEFLGGLASGPSELGLHVP